MECQCAICLKHQINLKNITLKQATGDHETWLEKLLKIVPEVDWRVNYNICVLCSIQLDECWKFRMNCLKIEAERQKLFENDPKEMTIKVEEIVIKDEHIDDYNILMKDGAVLDDILRENDTANIIEDKIRVKTYYCNVCELQFRDIYELLTHNKSNHKKEAAQSKRKSRVIEQQMPSIKCKTYNCDICCKKGFMMKALIKHYVDVHKVNSKLVKNYKCGLCSNMFTLPDVLNKHLEILHASSSQFNCSECEANFRDRVHLLEHYKTHKYRCNCCGRIYNKMIELKQHQSYEVCQKQDEPHSELVENSVETEDITSNLKFKMEEDDLMVSNSTEFIDMAIIDELTSESLPTKSKIKYEQQYKMFIKWRQSKKLASFSENVLLAYFYEQAKKLKASTLSTMFSKLRAVIMIKHDIDLRKYRKLVGFLKKQSIGYKPNKTKTLTRQQIEKFLLEAPDEIFLMKKVVLIIGIAGACGRDELTNMSVDDVQDKESCLVVNIPASKTRKQRSFVVNNENVGKSVDVLSLVRKYLSRRPKDVLSQRLFIRYDNKRNYIHVVGMNKIAKIASDIAEYLDLPDPLSYTGGCFRWSTTTF